MDLSLRHNFPPRQNLQGQLGPICLVCSGLGQVFRPRLVAADSPAAAGRLTMTARCVCGGTGVDPELTRQAEMERLYARLATLESHYRSLIQSKTKLPKGKLSRQYWMEAIAWATADGTAIANTTNETIIFPNVVIPANYLQDGRILRVTAYGRHSTTGTPTLTYRYRYGGVAGTVIAASGAMVTGSAVAAAIWKSSIMIQVRTNGATGTAYGIGEAEIADDATATVGSATNAHATDFMGTAGVATPATFTGDFTADTAFSITAQWSAASASNTLTGHTYFVESLN